MEVFGDGVREKAESNKNNVENCLPKTLPGPVCYNIIQIQNGEKAIQEN